MKKARHMKELTRYLLSATILQDLTKLVIIVNNKKLQINSNKGP